jgi:hypothetical protein
MLSDKRRSQRVARPIEVDCRTSDGLPVSGQVRISDISAHGAFVDTINPLPPGTPLALRFMLRDRLITVAAVVVNAMPQFGMGIGFLNVTPELESMLLSFVGNAS